MRFIANGVGIAGPTLAYWLRQTCHKGWYSLRKHCSSARVAIFATSAGSARSATNGPPELPQKVPSDGRRGDVALAEARLPVDVSLGATVF